MTQWVKMYRVLNLLLYSPPIPREHTVYTVNTIFSPALRLLNNILKCIRLKFKFQLAFWEFTELTHHRRRLYVTKAQYANVLLEIHIFFIYYFIFVLHQNWKLIFHKWASVSYVYGYFKITPSGPPVLNDATILLNTIAT